jgi:ABC-type uncharacterized transport system ATPase component
MEDVLRIFTALVGLTFVVIVFRNPTGTSTVIKSLAGGTSQTFGTFIQGVPTSGGGATTPSASSYYATQ